MSDAQAGFRTYIGLRYVPIIKGLWNRNEEYEALTIVLYEGNSYTSKISVPAGVDINNEQYWVCTGNYNIQVANLQQQIQNAVNLIADYETDFANFEEEMQNLYNNFVVDADGQIEEKVIEIENRLNGQYVSFTASVTNAVNEMRNDVRNFKATTSQMIDAFEEDITADINARFNRIIGDLNTRMTNFITVYNDTFENLQNQVNNLVLQAGNPESTSAEISQARGSYATLNARLNAIISNSMYERRLSAPSGSQTIVATVDFNTFTYIGSFYPAIDILYLRNTPFGEIANSGFNLIVTADNTNNRIFQTLYLGGYSHGFKRIRTNGVWSDWVMNIDAENGMIYKMAEHEGENPEYVYDFNTFIPNTCLSFGGYSAIEYKPSNSPDIPANEPYCVITFGSGGEKYQLCYCGTNNKTYFRHTFLGAYTSWDGYTTDSELYENINYLRNDTLSRLSLKKNGNIMNDLTAMSLESFNDSTFANNSINTVKLDSGILPNTTTDTTCYVLTINDGNETKQTFLDINGNTYFRIKTGGVWGNIVANTAFADSTTGGIVSIDYLNSMTFDENKTTIVRFVQGIIPSVASGYAYCYVNQHTYSDHIYQNFTCLNDGTIYTRYKYNGVWSTLTSPYYTKAEIDTMINP